MCKVNFVKHMPAIVVHADKSFLLQRHGAAVFDKNGKLLGISNNYYNPKLNDKRFSVHAEMGAWFSVPKHKRHLIYSMVVIRINHTTKNLMMSKPCRRCSLYFNDKNINIYYSK
jgi:hypothetical protein